MKFIKYFTIPVLTSLISLLPACSTTQDPATAYKNQTAEQIFGEGEKELHSHNYQEAIKHYEALDVQYPFGPHVQIIQLHTIYAYYMTGDYASAEAAADRFIHSYPSSPHTDYAYYMRGLSNYYQNLGIFEKLFTIDLATRDLSQVKKSYKDFSQLVYLFPNSYYAPAAHQYMVYLRNLLASHELEVAQYYFNRQAYVAAANRATLVVRHYEGSPVVPAALVLMAKSYRALHLKTNEQEVLEVIKYNFPNSDYWKEVTH